jgi:chromosome segregation ATPase
MDGHGTDSIRTRHIEDQLSTLKSELAEVTADNRTQMADLRADVGILGRAMQEQSAFLEKLDSKLDEQRTRRPDLLAIASVGISLLVLGSIMLGGMWTLQQAQLKPVISSVATHDLRLDEIRASRFTPYDAEQSWNRRSRELAQLRQDLLREHEETKEELQELDDRIRSMEKGVPYERD